MVDKKTVANVVTACVWIGSLIFLIWFCVVQFQRLKHTSVVTTSFSNPEAIQYPGLFICPSTLTVAKASPGATVSVASTFGATFAPFNPYVGDASQQGYAVCPRTVVFASPDGKTVQCVDFQPNPAYSAALTANNPDTCPDNLGQAVWFKADPTVPDPTAVWTANSLGNGLYVGLNSMGITHEPYMMLLYSSGTRLQPPTTFDQYAAIFPLTNFFLAHLTLQSYSAVNVDKLITDNWPADTNCNYEAFLSAVEEFTVDEPPFNSSERVATMLVGFDILEEVTTCHSPVLQGSDVLGIVGGGIALVLAVTIAFQLLVNKLLGVNKEPTDPSVQHSNYRPLGGDAL